MLTRVFAYDSWSYEYDVIMIYCIFISFSYYDVTFSLWWNGGVAWNYEVEPIVNSFLEMKFSHSICVNIYLLKLIKHEYSTYLTSPHSAKTCSGQTAISSSCKQLVPQYDEITFIRTVL